MKLIKITSKNGQYMESPQEDVETGLALILSDGSWGLPERPELDAEGNPTGNILPAEYTVEITDITAEHELQECIKNRKAEYPSPEEFMNAYFDGGETALQALSAARLAVKQKYPKPSKGEN